jgi:hypothetical protein
MNTVWSKVALLMVAGIVMGMASIVVLLFTAELRSAMAPIKRQITCKGIRYRLFLEIMTKDIDRDGKIGIEEVFLLLSSLPYQTIELNPLIT